MLLLFDIDATLLRVRHGVGRRVVAETMRTLYGVDVVPMLQSYTFAGKTERGIANDVLRAHGLGESMDDDAFERYRSLLELGMLDGVRPENVDVLPGVPVLLETLAAQADVHAALVTGNMRRVAFHKLRSGNLDHFFTDGAFGCEYADRSLLPPLARERVNRFRSAPYAVEQTIVIGDAPGDIDCARANGMPCLAVATGEFDETSLRAHGADAVLPSFADVDHAVEALRRLAHRA